MLKRIIAAPLLALALATSAQAQLKVAKVAPDVEARLTDAIAQAAPHLSVTQVAPGPFPGTYAISLDNGPVLYTDAKGELFVAGELYKIEGQQFVNLQELARQGERQPQLAALAAKDMIVFPAAGERKAAIYVFTDVDCGYCRKLHREVPAMNKAGIEVRYLAYPRAGIGSASYDKLVQAWCSDDRQDSLTKLKSGLEITGEVCANNPVADQYRLGGQMGVQGTPAIFLESGQLIPGYRPSADFIRMLGLES